MFSKSLLLNNKEKEINSYRSESRSLIEIKPILKPMYKNRRILVTEQQISKDTSKYLFQKLFCSAESKKKYYL